MKTNKLSLLLFFLPTLTLSNCVEGVLRCNTTTNTPEICDIANSYKLDTDLNECKQSTIEGCEIPSFDSSPCFLCEKGKIFDPQATKCVFIATSDKIPNCERYDSTGNSCTKCEEDYHIVDGKCVSLGEAKVPNCVQYDAEVKCLMCAAGFKMVENQCVAFALIQGCFLHTDRECTECESSYVLTKKSETFDDFGDNFFKRILQMDLNSGVWSQEVNSGVSCEHTSLQHCLEFESAKSCSKCQTGYFLNSSKICEENPEDPIAYCSVYENSTKCVKCEGTHYLSANTCLPVTEVANCHTYEDEQNKCKICNPGYFNNDTGTLCTLRSLPVIQYCKELNSLADSCSSCDPKYSLTQDSKKCMKDILNCNVQTNGADLNAPNHVCADCLDEYYLVGDRLCMKANVPKCLSHLSNQNKCEICDSGYYPSSDSVSCMEQSLDKCLSYETNKNECSKCEESYYITATKTCELKYVSFCVELSTGDTNTCEKCDNLRYLNGDKTSCLFISYSTNCNSTDGINDACLECKPGFFMNSNSCRSTDNRLNSQYDANCAGNTLTSLTTGCTRCAQNFSLLLPTDPSTTFADLNTRKCSSIDSSTGNCNQCDETYQLNSSYICELNASHATLACAQLQVDIVGGTLSTNTNCAKCADELDYYLENGECKSRTHISANDHCAEINTTQDIACTACLKDKLPIIPFAYKAKDIAQCELNTSLGFSLRANCLIHYSDGACAVCDHGFEWDDNTSSCSTTTNAVSVIGNLIWDEHMNIRGINSISTDAVANCNKWAQVGVNKVVCVGCIGGYIPAIYEPQDGDSDPMHFSTIMIGNSGEINYGSVGMPEVKFCIAQANQFRTGLNTNHVPFGACKWGIKKSGFSEVACQRCIDGKIGNIVELTRESDNTVLASSFKAIGDCADDIASSLVIYENIDYEIRTVTNRVRWSSYLEQTNCADSNKYLVAHIITSIKNPLVTLTTSEYASPSTDTPLQDCISSVFIDANLVSNCALYILAEDFTGDIDYSVLTAMDNFRCIACEPGYKSALDSNGEFVESCSQISSCDQTVANNKWMGACETPDNGSWNIEELTVDQEIMEMIAYHEPTLVADAVSNCLVVDSNRSECRMCEDSYVLSNGACSSVASLISNCHTSSIGEAFLNLSSSDVSTTQFSNFAFIRVPPSNSVAMTSNSLNCISCVAGRSLIVDKTTPVQVNSLKEQGNDANTKCDTPWIGSYTRGTAPDNCKFPDFTDSSKCYECDIGFTLNITDGTCVNHTFHLHCDLLETINNVVVCKTCRKSHYLDNAKTCQHRRCKYFVSEDSENCALCETNYMPLEGFPDRCQLNANRTVEDCDHYSPSLKHCIVCDNSSKIPFLYYHNGTLIKTECNSFPSTIKAQYGVQELFLEVHYTSEYSSTIPQLKYLPSEDSTPRVYTQTPALGLPYDNHCFDFPAIANCASDGINHGGVCFKCDHGFYLSDFNVCTEVIIHDCAEFTLRAPTCEKCQDTHFLSNNKTVCSNREHSKNCPQKALDSDTCLSCDYTKEYLDQTDHLCKSFTAENCDSKSQTLNVCVSCLPGFYTLDIPNGVSCNVYTADHCLLYANNKDECLTCQPNLWKNSSGGAITCNDYSARHCATFKPEADECQTCDETHWENVINTKLICENYTVLNCASYKPDNNECLLCAQGYYKTNLNCEPVTPVERCQTYSITLNQCVVCQFGSFLASNGSECRVNPQGIRFCQVYDAQDSCATCASTHFLQDTRCVEVPNPIAGCAKYNSETECGECATSKFLKENACVDITATFCETHQSEARCSTCISNHVLDQSTGNCVSSGITGCLAAVSGTPNICTQCGPELILSADSTSCSSPTTPVENCDEYAADGVCKRCKRNFILSRDLTQCAELTDKAGANCRKAIFVSAPTCDVCHFGFEKNSESVCVPYSDENCIFKKDGENTCSVCKSTSYMNGAGECVSLIVDDTGSDANEGCGLVNMTFLIWLGYFLFAWNS